MLGTGLALLATIAVQIPQQSGTTTEFRGLHAANDRVVWATGRNGVFTRTIDGGATWVADSIPGADSLFLVDVHATSATVACVLGTNFNGGHARIFRTDDGGRSWETAFDVRHPEVFLDGLAFWNERYGLVFGDQVDGAFFIARTEDGCRSWTVVPRDHLPPARAREAGFAASGTAIAVADETCGWIGLGGGTTARVLRTTDRGVTWTAHETPLPAGASAGIFGIAFHDARNGIAVGGDYTQPTTRSDNVMQTADGGETWRIVGSSAPAGVRWGVAAIPGMPAWYLATGPAGYGLTADGGASWVAIDTASVNTAAAAVGGVAWVAGRAGRILKVIVEDGRER